jgi:hypothetical protein
MMRVLTEFDYYEVCVKPVDREIHLVFVGKNWEIERMRNIYIREISPMVRANAGQYLSWEDRNIDYIGIQMNCYSWTWPEHEGVE